MEVKALLLTIFVGFIFILGIIIPKLFKNKNKLLLFTTGLSFIIMIALILIDLLPETMEVFEYFENPKNCLYFLIAIFGGILALKILDLFVPEHHHEHHENEKNVEEHNNHLYHIGLITSISLIIHNLLEGISIYITGINDIKLGIILASSVGLHNLPLGIEIALSMEANHKKKTTKLFIYILLILSSFIGAFLLFILKEELPIIIEGVLLSLTIGMLLYISMFELLPEVKNNRKKKEIKLGIGIGILIAILLFFI